MSAADNSAVRPLRTAVIEALRAASTDAGDRVYTPPVQEGTGLPYLLVRNYSEIGDNFAGRMGSLAGFDVHGFVRSMAGDAPIMELYEQVYAALNRVPLDVGGHSLLSGTLRLLVTYTDPSDGKILQFVARYEGVTRNQ